MLDLDDEIPEKQLKRIRNQIDTYSSPFHVLVDVLSADMSTNHIAQSMLVEYYRSSLSEHKLVVSAIGKRKSTLSYTSTQTLKIQLQQARKQKHEYVRLLLDTEDTHAVLQEREMAFLITHIKPPDISLTIKEVASHGCQLEIEIEWKHPYQHNQHHTDTIEFVVKGVCNHTGLLHPTSTKWNNIKCSHALPRVQDELSLPMEVQALHLAYKGKLRPDNIKCKLISAEYRKFIMHSDHNSSKIRTLELINDKTTSSSEKAYYVSYHGFLLAQKGHEEANEWLENAQQLNRESIDGKNYQLLQGRITRMMAKEKRTQNLYHEAEELIRQSLEHFQHAAPSNECACAFLEYATILQNMNDGVVDRVQVKFLLDHAMECVEKCKDVERSRYMKPMVFIEMALFYVHGFEKPTRQSATPSEFDLQRAEMLIRKSEYYAPNTIKSKKGNAYMIRQKVASAHLCYHRSQHAEAVSHMDEVITMMEESNAVDEHNLHIKHRRDFYNEMQHESAYTRTLLS